MIRRQPVDSPTVKNASSIRKAVGAVFGARPGIICAYLFGSRTSVDPGPLSDVDIAYASEHKLSMMEEADLLHELGRALQTDEVDLVNLRRLPIRNRLTVMEEGQILFQRNPEEVADLLGSYRLEYFDFMPYEREYDDAFIQNLRTRLS